MKMQQSNRCKHPKKFITVDSEDRKVDIGNSIFTMPKVLPPTNWRPRCRRCGQWL